MVQKGTVAPCASQTTLSCFRNVSTRISSRQSLFDVMSPRKLQGIGHSMAIEIVNVMRWSVPSGPHDSPERRSALPGIKQKTRHRKKGGPQLSFRWGRLWSASDASRAPAGVGSARRLSNISRNGERSRQTQRQVLAGSPGKIRSGGGSESGHVDSSKKWDDEQGIRQCTAA